jgi:hypothetical protein
MRVCGVLNCRVLHVEHLRDREELVCERVLQQYLLTIPARVCEIRTGMAGQTPLKRTKIKRTKIKRTKIKRTK